MTKRWIWIFLGIIVLAGCQQEEQALPTQMDLAAIAVQQQAEQATATESARLTAQPTNTAIRTGPTLPPTYTNTPLPTVTSTDPADVPTITPEGYSANGFIYYLYNGDAIMELAANGTYEEMILTFGVGQRITDLTLSPDKTLFAFIAPGNGSARELYIASRDGTYIQQISCLGFSEVHHPAWSPDGQRLIFYAAQSPGLTYSIYETGWVGSNTCPNGNNQRLLIPGDQTEPGTAIYSPDGTMVYFSNEATFALDLQTNTYSPRLTLSMRFGPDFGLTFNPTNSSILAYLRAESVPTFDRPNGAIIILDLNSTPPQIISEQRTLTQDIMWSRNGKQMLSSSDASVFLYNDDTKISNSIISRTQFPPQAIFSPDDTQIAFIDADPNNVQLPQIFTLLLGTLQRQQLTFHTEGTIDDMIWISMQ